jgi:hypothetical protein
VIFLNASSRLTRLFFAAVRTAFASSACNFPAKLPVLGLPVALGLTTELPASLPTDSTTSAEDGAESSPAEAPDFFGCCFFSLGTSGGRFFLNHSALSALVRPGGGSTAAPEVGVDDSERECGAVEAAAADKPRCTRGNDAGAPSPADSSGGVFCDLEAKSGRAEKK